jgi:hypothetical protein
MVVMVVSPVTSLTVPITIVFMSPIGIVPVVVPVVVGEGRQRCADDRCGNSSYYESLHNLIDAACFDLFALAATLPLARGNA